MQIKLMYKSYSGNGLDLKQGDICTVGEEMGRKLIETYPRWFMAIDDEKPKSTKPEDDPNGKPGGDPDNDPNEDPDNKKKGNEDGGGPNKETKPGKVPVKK
ncbi:MAG: hypothetical protein R3B95_11510 [Nitrospirales bacterium]|nr:hypothetical protein [Nitrospirales bacterium]